MSALIYRHHRYLIYVYALFWPLMSIALHNQRGCFGENRHEKPRRGGVMLSSYDQRQNEN